MKAIVLVKMMMIIINIRLMDGILLLYIDATDMFSSQVLDVLCSLCVCHGVAVRSNQHLICDNLLPGRDLLLQTRLINHVSRYTDTNMAAQGVFCSLSSVFFVCFFSPIE